MLVEPCGCLYDQHEYDDFPGIKFQICMVRCPACQMHKDEQDALRKAEIFEQENLYNRRKAHIDYLMNTEIDMSRLVPIMYLLKRIDPTVDRNKRRQLFRHIFRNDTLVQCFHIKKIARRYYCLGDVVDKCNIKLLFDFY